VLAPASAVAGASGPHSAAVDAARTAGRKTGAIEEVLEMLTSKRTGVPSLCIAIVLLLAASAWASKQPAGAVPAPPDLLLEGGRKLSYERSFSSEREVKIKRGFWTRVLDAVAGEPDYHRLIRPYSVVTDSHGRIIVTDPGAGGVHIFDFSQQKYKFISRDNDHDGLKAPQCVATDSADNIYVTDSESGKIFVFRADGKFQRVIGSLKGGEGFFKRPTGIAVDSQAQRIYVTDTLRDQIFVLDMQGNVVQTIGHTPGSLNAMQAGGGGESNSTGEAGPGYAGGRASDELVQFHFPTELRLHGDELIVVDAMDFRIQVLDRSGNFRYAIGRNDDSPSGMFRPKGVGVDSEGHLYVAESLSGLVQVFDREGRLLYYFGQKGTGFGEFQLPTGLFIDAKDRVYVVDSYNRRVQVFHYYAVKQAEERKER
jgi:sugar lactone lactonase YvrE